MKLHLNLSLRRALLAAMAAVATFASSATAGLVDARYDLQYYLDFGYNMGLFRPGATNITVPFKDGTSVSNATIPLMPNLDSYATRAEYAGSFGGGAGLVSPQYVASAAHCKEGNVYFITRSNDYSAAYSSTGYKSQAGVGSSDWSIQRLNKIVTEVAYTPYGSDDFMRNSMKLNETWLYRTGQGDPKDTNGGITTGRTPLGGLSNLSTINQNGTGTWVYRVFNREFDTANDTRPPLEISMTSGDSGSPLYAWDDANNQFVHVGFCSGGNSFSGYTGDIYICHNPTAYDNFIDSYEVKVNSFTGTEKILWGVQDATTGKGMLTQGSQSVEYTGAGSGNTVKDHLGLTFSTADSVNTQTIELQGSVNMGAGAMTFNEGSWKLTEKDAASTFNSAGFVVNGGADLTLELTASANEEWRKVGEGIMTIAGSGNNEAVLRVGGGNTVYNVTRDEAGNITGCTLGNLGETRLDREGGYAASSIRLEAGVASIALMRDGQFKTNSVAGDTFTFGNAGGLLNLNGHDLTWGVINQVGSGKGARIGNMTTQDGVTPNKTSTFTYTGTGTFDGCFMDEGADSAARLAVVYNNTAQDATWTLTGNHDIAGGYTVKAGTLVLQGTPTPHSYYNVPDDWDYASMQGSDVNVKSGAAFQLSHHALLEGDVTVENGGKFIINQVVNADAEAISGGMRQNMAGKAITSMKGDVVLKASGTTTAQMVADVSSSAVTTLQGNISVDDPGGRAYNAISLIKTGNGILSVTGQVNVWCANIEEGGLVVGDASNATDINNPYSWYKWTIGEKGFLAAIGANPDSALNSITKDSKGVFALTANQQTALILNDGWNDRSNLFIGAWGDVTYGTADQSLTAYNGAWRLGGGTGTLTVDFLLNGTADLLIGNEWSSGTVHLTNVNNQIGGDIIIKGTGNRLTYTDRAALGGAGILLTYGNSLMLDDTSLLEAIKPGAEGTIALRARDGEQFNLDLSSDERASLSVGADGDYTYTGNLSVKDTYRFGGSGNLTLDTELDGSKAMKIDGQGTTGSSVTFAREDAYTGSITAGGGLNLSTPNSRGDIGIHVGHGEALASVASIELQQGATLYMDGQSMEVRNLTAQSGSAISNNGEKAALLVLNVSEGESTSIADGVLHDQQNSAALHIVKSGTGTLTMGTNASWAGGMTISQGTVVAALSGTAYINAAGGIGNAASVITLEKEGTLQLAIGKTCGEDRGKLGSTLLPQTVLGTGTIVMSSGGEVLFSNQSKSFDGTIQLKGNTRLYVGDLRGDIGYDPISNLKALAGSTIVVEAGSQAKVTNTHRWGKQAAISTTANFTISGSGYAGASNWDILASRLTAGALAIDNNSTVYGNITLAGDAMISSSSAGTLEYYSPQSGLIPGDTSSYPNNATYGFREHLGGNIRGLILGEGKTLSIGGNESMTITADSANTYGNLVIANGNGHNSDQFALRLNGGKAVSQTSTALGKGHVTLSDGLILRLAGTGTANQANVEYTYANNIAAGNGATIQSYNITNKLTGTVSMAEGADKTLNLATAQGGVLHLSGGVSGSGTLNIGAASRVILGAGTDARAASSFTGNVVTAAGADLTLESAAAVAATTTISGTDSLTLRLAGTEDYTLGGISVSGENSVLTLHFDFTGTTDADNADTWTTLRGAITATTTTIALDLNMFNDISRGNYVLLAAADSDTTYTLADTLNNRLSLFTQDNGALVLKVDADNRLYWRPAADSNVWDAYTANWFSDKATTENGLTAFTSGAEVMLDESGVREGNSATSRETIGLADTLTVGNMAAQEAAYEIMGGGKIDASSLTVGNKGDLKLSNTGGNAFADGVLVNDSALMLRGSSITGNVELENAACMSLYNKSTVTGNVLITDSSMVVDNSIVAGRISTFELGSGAVLGTITESNGTASYSAGSLTVTHNAATGTDLHLSHGTLSFDSAFSVNKLTLDSGSTAVLRNNAKTGGLSNKISTLEMGDGAVLSVYNVVNDTSESADIGMVHLTGESATINEVYGSGYLKIGSLSMAEGLQSTTLNLTKASELNGASYTAVYEIGSEKAGNFVGDVVLSNIKQGNNNHSVFITLAGKETLANAVVKMDTQASSGGYLGLGIMADGAIIAGLQSSSSVGRNALLFSGEAIRGGGWNTGDENNGDYQYKNGGSRTLVIDSAEGSSYSYYGRILSGLSLVKTGEGTQAFYGRATGYGDQNFNGSIELQSGTLVFGADALGMLSAASSVTVNGGTLDISSYDFNTGDSLSINNFSFSDTSVLALGNLQADTTYNFFTTALENWMSLTADNFTINGTALSDWQRASLNLGMDGSFSYSIDSWDLVWKGGNSGTWTTASGNDVWQTTDGSSTSTGFCNGDNVTFESAATVTLGSDILVSTMNVKSGTVVVKDSGSYAFSAGTVNVAANSHLQMWNGTGNAGADNVLSKLTLGNGATFSSFNAQKTTAATRIGTLQLDGSSATLKDLYEGHSTYIAVETLNMGAGVTSSMLKLEKFAQSTIATLFEFGSANAAAGNFKGEVELRGHAEGESRSAFIIISGNNALAGAYIDIAATNSGSAYLGLGINTANATIAGLESTGMTNHAKLFSGTIGTEVVWGSGTSSIPPTVSDAVRTLTINTPENKSYDFRGEVLSDSDGRLNLVKSGKGSQSFTGSGSFGSVTVNEGTLTLGGTTKASGAMAINGGKLVLNQTTGTTFTLAGDVSGSGTLEVANGTTLGINNQIISSDLVLLAGASATYNTGQQGGYGENVRGQDKLRGNITVNQDAMLTFTGNAYDSIQSSATGKSITVNGGTIDFGSTRQTMGGWILNLSNDAKVIGAGGTYSGKQAAMDYNKLTGNIINATAGESTIESKTRLRGATENNVRTGSELTYNVAKGAILNVSGLVHADGKKDGIVYKTGEGTLHLNNANNDLGKILVQEGTANIHGAAAYNLTELQAAASVNIGFYAGATKDTSTKSSVAVSVTALLGGGASLMATSLTLNEGATLDMVDMSAGAVTLNGALTFGGQLVAGDNLLAILNEMSSWQSGELTLFTGLTSASIPTLESESGSSVLASSIFSNVQTEDVYVEYQVIDNVGSLIVTKPIPEPTTATLSLLALAGLCARRRRKD